MKIPKYATVFGIVFLSVGLIINCAARNEATPGEVVLSETETTTVPVEILPPPPPRPTGNLEKAIPMAKAYLKYNSQEFEEVFSDLIACAGKYPNPGNPGMIKSFLKEMVDEGRVDPIVAKKRFQEYFSPKIFVTMKYGYKDSGGNSVSDVKSLCEREEEFVTEIQAELDKKKKAMLELTDESDQWKKYFDEAKRNAQTILESVRGACEYNRSKGQSR